MTVRVQQIQKLKGHNASVYALSEGQGENIFFSGGGDNRVAAWNLDTMEPEKFLINHSATVYSLSVIDDKFLLIGDADGSIYVIDIKSKTEIHHFQAHQQAVFDIKYSRVNQCFYSVSMDGSLACYDSKYFRLIKKLRVSKNKVRKIALSPREDLVAIACTDSVIRIYESKGLDPVKALWGHSDAANALVFHPHKSFLLSGGKDAHLRVWDIEDDYRQIRSLPAHYWAIYNIDFHPEGKYFATASRDKSAKIWNADTFEVIAKLDLKNHDAHRLSVNNLLWHPYRNILLTTGDDRTIISWKLTED